MGLLTSIGAAFCGVIAAALWFIGSSTPPSPPSGAFAEAVVPALETYGRASRKSAFIQRTAAVFALVGSTLSIVAAVAGAC